MYLHIDAVCCILDIWNHLFRTVVAGGLHWMILPTCDGGEVGAVTHGQCGQQFQLLVPVGHSILARERCGFTLYRILHLVLICGCLVLLPR